MFYYGNMSVNHATMGGGKVKEGREEPRRCTATRTNGKACRAWAQQDSDPALCSAHAAGASSPAKLAGKASDAGPAEETPSDDAAAVDLRDIDFDEPITITSIIEDLAKKQNTLSKYLDRRVTKGPVDLNQLAHLFALHGLNASRLGRLLRDARALSGEAADGIAGAIAQALDELSTELGADL
jgi:hypothetical protein